VSNHFRVRVPGRVNLIGDHTDYTGGLVMPMTIDRWTVIEGERQAGPIELVSADEPEPVRLSLPVADAATVEPHWGRYVAGVAAEMGADAHGVQARITTDIPVGAGLSSSAALELATALALGFEGDPIALAELGRRAEHRASGVPCGIMDQLSIAAGVEGHALLIDCHDLTVEPVPLPADIAVIVRFVQHRTLVGSEYADRVDECAAAEASIGPLRLADLAAVDTITDDVIRRRARHVVTENQRVRDFAEALRRHDLSEVGRLMLVSHDSLRDDFEISTAVMDAAVADLAGRPGVHGARMTGGGFGGCIVAIADAASASAAAGDDGWIVHAVDGAISGRS
jgi:galactokinase